MERCTFRTIKKVMMAIKLATAWIKNSVRFIILFHKDEGDRCTGTKCKSNEESLKEFAHPRIEVVIHQISDGIGHSDSRNEGHDTACDNEIGIGRKTTIARPDMGQKNQRQRRPQRQWQKECERISQRQEKKQRQRQSQYPLQSHHRNFLQT